MRILDRSMVTVGNSHDPHKKIHQVNPRRIIPRERTVQSAWLTQMMVLPSPTSRRNFQGVQGSCRRRSSSCPRGTFAGAAGRAGPGAQCSLARFVCLFVESVSSLLRRLAYWGSCTSNMLHRSIRTPVPCLRYLSDASLTIIFMNDPRLHSKCFDLFIVSFVYRSRVQVQSSGTLMHPARCQKMHSWFGFSFDVFVWWVWWKCVCETLETAL